MKEYELLYQIKDLEKNIIMYITKNKIECNEFPLPTPTQIRIVDYILKHDKNSIYQKDLEKNLNLTRATLSGVLKTMEKNGIINRVVNNHDARSKKIILSDKASKKFKEGRKRLEKTESILTNNISNEEIEMFKNILIKMKANISKYNK